MDLNASPTTSDEPSLNLEPTEGDGLDNAVEVEVPQDELNESIARIASTHTPLSNGILCQAAGQMAVSAPVSLIELGRFDETEETEAQKNSDNVAADYRTSDDCTFQSALTRMIDSPEPPISTSYKFTNIAFTDDNGEDQIEHQRIVDVVTVLSRSGSRETLEEQELDPIKAKNMALIKEEVDHVELLRPSTPTKADLAAVHPDVHSLADPLTASKQNSSTEEHTESQETPVPVVEAVPEPPEFDRAEVTARIRANLELKDRYKAKNVALQARLAEYFRKRRV